MSVKFMSAWGRRVRSKQGELELLVDRVYHPKTCAASLPRTFQMIIGAHDDCLGRNRSNSRNYVAVSPSGFCWFSSSRVFCNLRYSIHTPVELGHDHASIDEMNGRKGWASYGLCYRHP